MQSVREGLDGTEIAVRHPFRTLEAADVVVHVTEGQVHDAAVQRTDVRRARVDHGRGEDDHAAGGSGRGDAAALLGEPRDSRAVEGPQGIARRLEVVPGLEDPVPVAPGQQDQRPVGGAHLVQEHRDVHRARLRHLVVAVPGAEVLVPLPDLAVESRLGVDLVLVHVHRSVHELHHRFDEAGMTAEAPEGLVVRVGGERRAGHAAGLPPHLLAVHGVDLVRGPAQHGDLVRREAVGPEHVALVVEPRQFFRSQLHDACHSTPFPARSQRGGDKPTPAVRRWPRPLSAVRGRRASTLRPACSRAARPRRTRPAPG